MNNCGDRDAAKSLLASYNLSFKEINITDDDQKRFDLVETHHRTMPQIFIDGSFIGGYTELRSIYKKRSVFQGISKSLPKA